MDEPAAEPFVAPFIDRLIDAVRAKRSPVCVGIDPMPDKFPPELRPGNPRDLPATVAAVNTFCRGVIDSIADVAPAVKFQSAYFERLLWPGVQLYYELVGYARSLGLLVIGDVKRGDIGATSEAYAAAHLAEPAFDNWASQTPDAITINPFLGIETLEPFFNVCDAQRKGVFVLVRTSNPGSKDVQDLLTDHGDTFSEHLAGKLDAIKLPPGMLGRHGYGSLGAVVGATQTHTMTALRERLPTSYFLLPGYGTQGATADMTKAAFDVRGLGALVSASRSVLYPPRSEGESWQATIRRAAETMRDDLAAVVSL